MKPEGAIEFITPMDLSEASYEEAVRLLGSEMLKDGLSYSVYGYKLKCSLWDLDVAVHMMAKFRNCDLEVSRYYDCDEWSLTATRGEKSYTVWCAGA